MGQSPCLRQDENCLNSSLKQSKSNVCHVTFNERSHDSPPPWAIQFVDEYQSGFDMSIQAVTMYGYYCMYVAISETHTLPKTVPNSIGVL